MRASVFLFSAYMRTTTNPLLCATAIWLLARLPRNILYYSSICVSYSLNVHARFGVISSTQFLLFAFCSCLALRSNFFCVFLFSSLLLGSTRLLLLNLFRSPRRSWRPFLSLFPIVPVPSFSNFDSRCGGCRCHTCVCSSLNCDNGRVGNLIECFMSSWYFAPIKKVNMAKRNRKSDILLWVAFILTIRVSASRRCS